MSEFYKNFGQREPIAIIGIGCRFPGAENPEALWVLLRDGVDAIAEIPSSRWDVDAFYNPDPAVPDKMNTRQGGYLKQVDRFECQFFDISPQEATSIDPQQRLLLEVTWEAIEDAGLIPEQLAGSETGVFIGMGTHDYSVLTWEKPVNNPYATTGTGTCIAANRLSYFFNFTGPSLVVETACSSSLVAVHLACQSLWCGESVMAIAGGVNVLLLASSMVSFTKAGMLSPDARCKTFDARADGYGRSEGAGVVILKPLSRAIADGDDIYAVICGGAVNQDGRSNGLSAPNPQAQQSLLKKAYQQAGISPSQVQYVEAHGTGTLLGDAMEIKALGAVIASDRSAGDYCRIGSIKTNIGHLEAAAGIAALIKVALALKYQQIPPSLHFQTPNPYIRFDRLPLRVQQTLETWPQTSGQSLAGVSAFGFGGTNAHLILAGAPPISPSPRDFLERPFHLLTLSAKSAAALQEMAEQYQTFLTANGEISLADFCYSSNRRAKFDRRLAIVTHSVADLIEKLRSLAIDTIDRSASDCYYGNLSGQITSRKLAFFYPASTPYLNMGRELWESQPTFRFALEECEAIAHPYLHQSLREVLYKEAGEAQLQDPIWQQVSVFAIEYALTKLWQSWGIVPTAVSGDGVGKCVAACVAGICSLEDGLQLAASGQFHQKGRLERDWIENILTQMTFSRPKLIWIDGQSSVADATTIEYWLESLTHLRAGKSNSQQILYQPGYKISLEISPHPTPETATSAVSQDSWLQLSSLHRDRSDWQQMLESLAQLYISGYPPDWAGFDREYPRQRVKLPTYPWQRSRYWLDSSFIANVDSREMTEPEKLTETSHLKQGVAAPAEPQPTQPSKAVIITCKEPPDAETIKQWLIDWAVRELQLDIKTFDSNLSLENYGLESATAVQLTQDLETWLNCSLDVTMLWSYPTIPALGDYLTTVLNPEKSNQLSEKKHRQETSNVALDNRAPDELEAAIARELALLENLLGNV